MTQPDAQDDPNGQDASEVNLEDGQTILTAVERILEAPEKIIARVEQARADSGAWDEPDLVAPKLISSYSNKSALIGGATAIPAMLPGVGTAVTLLAGPMADMVLLLKLETELCLALSCLRGHDICDPKERQLAFLLAAINTAELSNGRNSVLEVIDVSGTAIWNYAPRRVGKVLVSVLAVIAALQVSKTLLKAVPLIGVAVGASMNKVLTSRVGKNAYRALKARDSLATKPVQP